LGPSAGKPPAAEARGGPIVADLDCRCRAPTATPLTSRPAEGPIGATPAAGSPANAPINPRGEVPGKSPGIPARARRIFSACVRRRAGG